MRTKLYNGISGTFNIICGIYLGIIAGYKELDLCGFFLALLSKSDATLYITGMLMLLIGIAGYVGMIARGFSKIKSLYRPYEENKVVWLWTEVISLIGVSINYIIYTSEDRMIMYIVSIIILLCEIIILLIEILKKKLKLFTEGNCLDIVSRITRTAVPVIIIGMVIIFKSYFVANAEQMEMFQSLNGGFDSFTMTDFEGNEYTEDMFKGHKVTMINIWATTCHGCIMEMPDLQEISEMYDEKDFQLVGIVADLRDYNNGEVDEEQVNLATDVMDMTGVKYTTLIPSMEIQMGVLRSVIAYPTTIFLDENGNQLKVMEGSRSKSMWIDTIEEVIESEK